jgi:hypothetical protein
MSRKFFDEFEGWENDGKRTRIKMSTDKNERRTASY